MKQIYFFCFIKESLIKIHIGILYLLFGINIFMHELIMQRDKDVKRLNYKCLQDVEEEMILLINYEISDS